MASAEPPREITLALPDGLRSRLQDRAVREGKSVAEVMLEAAEAFVSPHDEQSPELQEMLAWERADLAPPLEPDLHDNEEMAALANAQKHPLARFAGPWAESDIDADDIVRSRTYGRDIDLDA